MKYTCAILLSTFCCFQAVAQADKMQTDRPDQSEGAQIITAGHVQVETVLILDIFRQQPEAFISSTNIRYGIVKKFETRLLVEQGDHRDVHIESAAHAQYPLAISSKWTMVEHHSIAPDLAMLVSVQIPFTNGKNLKLWSPLFVLIAEKRISDLTLTGNWGIREAAFERTWAWQASADGKYALGKKLDVFAEYFAQYAVHENPLHNIDGGMLFHFSKYFLVHLAAGTSIFHRDGYYFFNTGLAVHI